MTKQTRFLKKPEVLDRAAICNSKMYQMIADGSFPRPVKLGRSSAWIESEIEAWLHDRIAERDVRASAA